MTVVAGHDTGPDGVERGGEAVPPRIHLALYLTGQEYTDRVNLNTNRPTARIYRTTIPLLHRRHHRVRTIWTAPRTVNETDTQCLEYQVLR